MSKAGRVEGRVNGDVYEIVQHDTVRQSYPLDEAAWNEPLKAAIKRNRWEDLP